MNVMMEKKVEIFGGLYNEVVAPQSPLDDFKAKA